MTETGTTTRTKSGEAWATVRLRGCGHVAPSRAGSPDGRAAAARSAGPLPQVCGTRRYAVSMIAAAKTGGGPSSVPGILSPRKITVKGAPVGRVAKAMGASAHP